MLFKNLFTISFSSGGWMVIDAVRMLLARKMFIVANVVRYPHSGGYT